MPELTELIANAPWPEAVTYRETWPHEYVMSTSHHQRELLAAICERFRKGEGVPGRFFSMENTYLFIGNHKYWLMTQYENGRRNLESCPAGPAPSSLRYTGA